MYTCVMGALVALGRVTVGLATVGLLRPVVGLHEYVTLAAGATPSWPGWLGHRLRAGPALAVTAGFTVTCVELVPTQFEAETTVRVYTVVRGLFALFVSVTVGCATVVELRPVLGLHEYMTPATAGVPSEVAWPEHST